MTNTHDLNLNWGRVTTFLNGATFSSHYLTIQIVTEIFPAKMVGLLVLAISCRAAHGQLLEN